jgi:Ca-activated chloride channel family protein
MTTNADYFFMPDWFFHIPRPEFGEPWWLMLLPLLALFAWLQEWRERQGSSVIFFPALERLQASGFEARRWLRFLPQWLRWCVLVLSVLALAEPRLLFRQAEAEAQGIDVMLALDISESMLQRDITGKSRLDAAREVARSFVLRRSNDRIGLVVFRGEGYTQCPLTLDHDALAMLLDHLSTAVIRDDGTAIGTAILIAINRLKVSESTHKVIILVTDGENNAGEVGPATAAVLARRSGIRIYAINAGFKTAEDRPELSEGSGNHTAKDEESLKGIARTTGGGYFTAQDPAGLEATIRMIDRQEKGRHAWLVMEHRSGLFFFLLLVAVVLLFVEVVLANSRLLRIP